MDHNLIVSTPSNIQKHTDKYPCIPLPDPTSADLPSYIASLFPLCNNQLILDFLLQLCHM